MTSFTMANFFYTAQFVAYATRITLYSITEIRIYNTHPMSKGRLLSGDSYMAQIKKAAKFAANGNCSGFLSVAHQHVLGNGF